MAEQINLNEIPEKTSKIKKYGILLIVGLVALTMLGFGMIDVANVGSNYVLKLKDKKVTPQKFNQFLEIQKRQYMFKLGLSIGNSFLNTKEFSNIILNQMADNLIISRVLADNGIVIDKHTIKEYVLNNPDFQDTSRKFDKEKYQLYLQQLGLSEELYIFNQSIALQTQFLLEVFALNDIVFLNNLAKNLIQKEEQKRKIQIKKFKINKSKTFSTNEEEMLQFYNQHKNSFVKPEEREVLISKITEKTLNKTPTEEEIIKEYNNQYLYKNQNVSFYKLSFNSIDEAKQVYDLIKQKNTTLKDVAMADLGLSMQDIYFKDLNYSELDVDFADAILNSQKLNVSDIFYSNEKYNIIEVKNIKKAKVAGFESLKNKIANNLKSQVSCSDVQYFIDNISLELESGANIKEVIKNSAPLSSAIISADSSSDLPDEIKNSINQNSETSYAEVLNSPTACEFFVYQIQNIKPQSFKDIEEVKDEIIIKLNYAKAKKDALKQANEYYQNLLNKNTQFALDQTITINSQNDILSEDATKYIFNSKKDDITPPYISKNEEEFAIFKVIKIEDIKLDQISDEQVKKKVESIKSDQKDLLLQKYMEGLRKKYKVQFNSAYI